MIAMPHRNTTAWTDDGELEVLTFGLGGETFALEAVLVREILDLMPETRVPGADRLAASVINFRGRIIPLARINDVAYEKGLIDRMLRCGTLVIHDASQQAGLQLHDIPHLEDFHRRISRLVLASHAPEARRDEQS